MLEVKSFNIIFHIKKIYKYKKSFSWLSYLLLRILKSDRSRVQVTGVTLWCSVSGDTWSEQDWLPFVLRQMTF